MSVLYEFPAIIELETKDDHNDWVITNSHIVTETRAIKRMIRTWTKSYALGGREHRFFVTTKSKRVNETIKRIKNDV